MAASREKVSKVYPTSPLSQSIDWSIDQIIPLQLNSIQSINQSASSTQVCYTTQVRSPQLGLLSRTLRYMDYPIECCALLWIPYHTAPYHVRGLDAGGWMGPGDFLD